MVSGVTESLQSWMSEPRKAQVKSFLMSAGWGDARSEPIAGDASFRSYCRLCKGSSSIVFMDAPPEYEDLSAFIKVSHILRSRGLSAPCIEAVDSLKGDSTDPYLGVVKTDLIRY